MSLLDRPFQPAWLLARASKRLLDEVPTPEAWIRAARAAAERGPVVYVLRNESLLDLLALEHLTRRYTLPRIGFANELGGWIDPFYRARGETPEERLRAALSHGQSALLFMKRPPSVLDRAATGAARGRSEGEELLVALLELQRNQTRPIVLLPQTFVWTQRPERRGLSIVDTLFGPAEFPGELRSIGQFVFNHRNCVLRAGEPLALGELLEQETGDDDKAIARRLTYALLRKVERERRSVLGPVQKPADRVREEVLRSPKLQTILRDLAGPGAAERALLEDKARGMLRELEATPDPATLKGLEILAQTLVDRVYAGVDVDAEGIERVRDAARKGSLVLLPSHKSHVDYMLLSFVLRKNALQIPVIAAGDNLAFFPVGPLFRNAGAFFIRRSFRGDRLYTAVVDAYIRRLIRDGFAIEFFLEGGRSRAGKLLSPKLGLLNMVVDAALGVEGRTISFVPVSIGYERTMEDGAYARELSGAQKRREDAAALLKLSEVLREKYGRANVQFGRIIELGELRGAMGLSGDAITPAKRRALVTRLAHQVMSEINRVTAVTPGSLVAMVLLCHGRRGLSHVELVEHCARLVKLVQRLGARTTPSLTRGPQGALRESSVRDAALLYVRGGLVRQHVPGDTLTGSAKKRARIYTGDDVIYTVPEDKRLSLDIAKNVIVHLFVGRALVALSVLAPHASVSPPDHDARAPREASRAPGPPATSSREPVARPQAPGVGRGELRERVQSLSRLFKHEFMFRVDASFDDIFGQTVADMCAEGELAASADGITPGPGHDGLDGRGWLAFYAAVIRNFVESYRVAARSARVLTRAPMAESDLVARALRIGEQMFLGGEIERSEAVSQPTIENAFAALVDQGYIARSSGKLALAESFASDESALAIEAKIAGYLLRRSGESSF
jgi:glycerol-3-phosphate O-acyltransferase